MPDRTSNNAKHSTLARRLAIGFALVATITALLTATMVTVTWNQQFDTYIRGQLQGTADSWAQVFASGYAQTGTWAGGWLTQVPRFGMARGTAVELMDATGTVLMQDVGPRRSIGAEIEPPAGPVVTAPVVVGANRVGTVRVWSPQSNQLLSDLDERFRQAAFLALLIAALIAVGFASLAGVWYARRVTRPIQTITETAQALRGGDQAARTHLEGDDEIGMLGRTFDEMADAIEADRELERRLTADVAHELRTPLQAIQATVEAMQDGVLPADSERLGVVRDETVRLARLADGILELTRLERGSARFEMQRLDVAVPVRAAVDTHRALVESLELVMTVDIADRTFVVGDDERLRQAFGNLISNAARYTPDGGRIEVVVRSDAGEAIVSISDTGIGIADEDLPHVFSRFWRADEARSRETGGLGIGLAVVKEIVDRHGGHIGVASRAGGGTIFTVRLPLADANAPGPRMAQQATSPRGSEPTRPAEPTRS